MRSYRGLRGGDVGGEEGGEDSDRGFKGRKKVSAFDKQLADAQKVAEEEEKALEEVRGRTLLLHIGDSIYNVMLLFAQTYSNSRSGKKFHCVAVVESGKGENGGPAHEQLGGA